MSISPMQLGAKGNGTTDDSVAVQKAVDKSAAQWCDGAFKTFAISKPIVLHRPAARVRQLTLKALPNFAQGTMLTTAEGLQKVYADDLTLDGNPGVDGLFASLQQSSELRRLRVNNCAVGYKLIGQQAVHSNLEIVGCGKGLVLGGLPNEEISSFMYFYGSNIEQCGVGIEPTNSHNGGFWGLHMEANENSIHFPPGSAARALVFDTIHMPAGNSVVCESDRTSYEIRNWMPQGGATDTLIVDTSRGYTIMGDQWGDGYTWESSFVQRRGQVPPLMRVRDAA